VTRPVLLSAAGVAAFLVFAVASMPARVVFDAVAGPAGVSAGLVQGTVWDARLLRLSAGGAPVAELDARLRPAGLLSGAARFDVTVRDPGVRGSGVLALSPGAAAVESGSGVIALSRLPSPIPAPPGASVQVEIDRLAVDGQGRCVEAEGRVTSAALTEAGEGLGVALPLVSGAFLCAGEHVGLQLEGASQAVVLSGLIRFEPAGPVWRIEARSDDRDVVAALSLSGFVQDGPNVFVLDSETLEGGG